MPDDDPFPTMTTDKVINPALARFLGAPSGATIAIQADGVRRPVQAVFYDNHANEIVVVPCVVEHIYLSTGCLHGKHGYCQSATGAAGAKTPASCKFCAAPCRCSCHRSEDR